MQDNYIEKTMNACGYDIKIQGRFIRIAGLSADTYEFVEKPAAVVDALRSAAERVDLFTFMQKLPDTTPKYSYLMEWDNLAVLPVSTFDHWWTKQINDKTRNMARRAGKKGVVIREVPLDEAFIEGVWAIYNECEIRQGKRFPHYGKDLAAVRRMMVTFPDRSVFMGAYFDNSLIGFARLHCDATRTQAGISSILSLTKHRDKSPTNALLAEAVRYSASHGIPYLVYSRYSDGNKERDSLMEFKDHNGFQRVNLPRYYIPLTPRGQMALSLGLHKRLVDKIPDSIMSRLRFLRKTWYSWKAQPVGD
jgi:hypothetical protein